MGGCCRSCLNEAPIAKKILNAIFFEKIAAVEIAG